MCQSKSEGGKRCFLHSSGTKATLSYINVKTGIDKAQIYAIMKELRKEGRMLDAPTPEELEKYFDLEEFKLKFDNTLTEKERVLILKQLLAARSEAKEQGVQGGVFHAWKNALKRTVERFKKPLAATAIVGSLIFSAGCSAGTVDPTPTDTNTSSPTASECVVENPEELTDAIPGELVEDEYGTYCSLELSPDAKSKFLKLDDLSNKDEIIAAGFTEEDFEKAQELAYTFAVEQTIDSTRLDNYSQPLPDWMKENNNVISSEARDIYLKAASEPDSNLGLIVTDVFPGPLSRDKAPRATNVEVSTNGAEVVSNNGKSYLNVGVGIGATYKTTEDNAVALIQKYNPGKSPEEIKAENPSIQEGNGEAYVTVVAKQNFAIEKNDIGKSLNEGPISGTAMQYSVFLGETPVTTKDW